MPNTPNTDLFGCLETPPKTALQRAADRLPKACPSCASPLVAPLFEGDLFDCGACGHVWEID